MRPAAGLVLVALSLAACGGGDDGASGAGTGGAGQAGSGTAGSGTAGSGTAGSGTSGSGTAGSGPVETCGPTNGAHVGEATFYDFADGSGNCGFPKTPNDLQVGAMNHTDYAASASCGACAKVKGPNGTITIRIVDQCPECKPGDIDLSPSAFAMLAPLEKGRVDITWDYVPCAVTGPVVYHFKDGSNPYWTAIQVRNHKNAVAKLEAKKNGAWAAMQRLDYNYFVDASGLGPGPYELRVTDVNGNVLEDAGIPSLDDADAPGKGQFPTCP